MSHKGPTRPDPTIDIVPSELVTPASPARPPPDASGEFDVESAPSIVAPEPDSGDVAPSGGRAPSSDGQTPPATSPKPPEPDYAPRIAELENAYPSELVTATRLACQRSRKTGRMAPGVWLSTLEKLAAFAPEIVVAGLRIFVDRYSTGEHDEKYLLGIVRGESERHRKTTTGWRPPVAPEAYRESATTQQELDQLYGDLTPEDFARVERLGNRRTHG